MKRLAIVSLIALALVFWFRTPSEAQRAPARQQHILTVSLYSGGQLVKQWQTSSTNALVMSTSPPLGGGCSFTSIPDGKTVCIWGDIIVE